MTSRSKRAGMVVRTRNHSDELVITLMDARGAVLHQETCDDGHQAARKAAMAIARRDPIRAGDMLRVTVRAIGDIHQARDTD
jgi:hypothetical protein